MTPEQLYSIILIIAISSVWLYDKFKLKIFILWSDFQFKRLQKAGSVSQEDNSKFKNYFFKSHSELSFLLIDKDRRINKLKQEIIRLNNLQVILQNDKLPEVSTYAQDEQPAEIKLTVKTLGEL